MVSNSSFSPTDPYRAAFGKYVPAKNGFCSAVMKILVGQPPLPVNAWQTVI